MSEAQEATRKVGRAIAGMITGVIPELDPFSFYGWMAAQLPRAINNSIPTMALAYSYDIMEPMIIFNQDFVNQQTLKEIRAIIVHEVDHLVHRHPNRRGSRDPERFNIAADMAVNHDIEEDLNQKSNCREYIELPEWCIKPAEGVEFKTAETYYKIVEKKDDKNGAGQWVYRMNGEPDKQVQGDADKANSAHDSWATFDDLPEEEFDAQILDLMQNACDSAGSVPGSVQGVISGLMKPKISWRHILRNFVGINTRVGTYKTWSKPNRRTPRIQDKDGILWPIAQGKRWERSGVVGVLVDTSGSVSDNDLVQVFTEINSISQSNEVWVIECDAQVQDMYKYNAREYKVSGKNVKGRGGTNMNPGLDAFNKFKDVEMIICITDGCLFQAPLPVCKPELWVISSGGSDQYVQDRRHVIMPET